MNMFRTATYRVRADENDFPYIGQVIDGKIDGIDISTVVKEIQSVKWQNPNWQEDGEMPVVVLKLLVLIDEQEFNRKKKKQKALQENKLVILDGKNNHKKYR